MTIDGNASENGMANAASSLRNLARLKEKLKKGTLAARLVEAYATAAAGAEQAGLRTTIANRLDELRRKYAGTPNHRA
jgi:hypothetical protein